MDEVQHFTYGWITPAFAFATSFLGSLLGLISTARARAATDRRRRAWLLVLAAWAIGGTGIWVMHFMAMVGFSVTGSPLRYDVPITVASFLIAVLFVGIGLFIVGFGRPRAYKVLLAGPITGIAVAFMHYTGMAAMQVNGTFGYDPVLVVASFAIAVVAATVALWFTLIVKGAAATAAAGAVMAVAVCGMHYTGMAAMHVHLADGFHEVSGLDVNWFLAPIILFILVVVISLASAVMATPSTSEQDAADQLRDAISSPGDPTPVSGGFGGTFSSAHIAGAAPAVGTPSGGTPSGRIRPGGIGQSFVPRGEPGAGRD